jgi:prefoldin subunit 5
MATENLLAFYLNGVNCIIENLDGLNDKEYIDFSKLLDEFYDVCDSAESLDDLLIKKGFSDDHLNVSDSLLIECKEKTSELSDYNERSVKNLSGFKKIVSVSLVKRLKAQVTEYENKLQYIDDCVKLLNECKSLIEKYEKGLSKYSLSDKTERYITIKDSVYTANNAQYTSVDDFCGEINKANIEKNKLTLKDCNDSLNKISKSFDEYNRAKKSFHDYLVHCNDFLETCLSVIIASKLNPEDTKYNDAKTKVTYYIAQISSFTTTTRDPSAEFAAVFNVKSIKSSIDELIAIASTERSELQAKLDELDQLEKQINEKICEFLKFKAKMWLLIVSILYLSTISFKAWIPSLVIIFASCFFTYLSVNKIKRIGKSIVLDSSYSNGCPDPVLFSGVVIAALQLILGTIISFVLWIIKGSEENWNLFFPIGWSGLGGFLVTGILAFVVSIFISRFYVNMTLKKILL